MQLLNLGKINIKKYIKNTLVFSLSSFVIPRRHLLGITKLDKEKNQCIREKTGAENIVKEIKQYQEKWLQLIRRMDTNRISKQALKYKPKDEDT